MAGVRGNLIATVYGTAVVTIGQITLVPLFLNAWGPVVYGHWLVLTAVPAYLALSDVGIGNVLGNLLSISVEQGRLDEARRMLGAALRYQAFFALGLFLVAAGLVVTLPIGTWLEVNSVDSASTAIVLLVLVAYSLLPVQIGCFIGLYRAAGTYPRYLFLQGHARLLEIICTVGLLAGGGSVATLAFTMLAVRFLWFSVVALDARGKVLGLSVTWSEGTWRDFRSLLPAGAGYFAFPVGNSMVNQGVLLVVNQLGGALAVVELSVCRQVCRAFLQMTSALFTAVHPELTVAFARGDRDRLLTLQAGSMAFVALFGALFISFCSLAGSQIVHWWTCGVAVSVLAVALLAVEAVTAGLANVSLLAPWAANRLEGLPLYYLGSQVVALLGLWLSFGCFKVGSVGLIFSLANIAFGVMAFRQTLILTCCRFVDFPRHAASGLEYILRAPFRR